MIAIIDKYLTSVEGFKVLLSKNLLTVKQTDDFYEYYYDDIPIRYAYIIDGLTLMTFDKADNYLGDAPFP